MSNVFISGLPRSGTTFTRWIFQYAGYAVTNELHINKNILPNITAIMDHAKDLFEKQSWRNRNYKTDIDERLDSIMRSIYGAFSDELTYEDTKSQNVFFNKTPNLNFDLIESLFQKNPKYIISVRNPIDNILSMCNTNFGKNNEEVNGFDNSVFEKSIKKFSKFYNKVFNIEKERVFFFQIDKFNEFDDRVHLIGEMFKFSAVNMDLNRVSERKHKKDTVTFGEFVRRWPIINLGKKGKYQKFSPIEKNILLCNKDIIDLCNRFDYNLEESIRSIE